ncbi:alpha-1,4-glucan--maltose-1-phosphate maltosyltransferase, partial [Acidisphaera rubrifaciens]|uniref:alpha-1,4-glucan--maltose-1-phosphate maltosyltransferase n=1 Tax=Acidisphaera rubrifaciens TaxID=50715 RepID=UPI00066232E1
DLAAGARAAAAAPRIGIEAITPSVDAGRFPARRVVGETVTIETDIIFDGHDQYAAALLWQAPGDTTWHEVRMRPLGNDRWQADLPLAALGRHAYTIEAWRDGFATWADEVAKKSAAGVDTHVELIEGRHLVETHAAHAAGADRAALEALRARLVDMDDDAQRALLLDPATAALMARADPRPHRVRHQPALCIVAERPGAAFASWYEIFPRSMSDDPARHGTFDDVIRHLPRVRDMGFDVLYFPPIHPIGRTNRKGRNNSLRAGPDDVGSPYAIGGAEGGHDALHPALGTLDDFRRLVDAAAGHGLELAIDFAIQCSPDHPWLAAHRDWFAWRPDGSIKYAENPPKKYEDIVNVDFYADGAKPALWVALCEVVLFWCEQGVRLFRVDNPHTKPLPFWEWMIGAVQARFPDAVFLAEAFTRPKVMYRLAKSGFGQSYTYFTWRNTKRELTEYLTELTTTAPRDFFRPHFFVNTPDINPPFLQTGGRPAHLIRAALAATLSGLWGVYCGFELCEATPLPGREEYLDSEKYQIRAWDWHRPGNIVADIARLNTLRRENPALQTHLNVRFGRADNEAILWYEKATPDRSNFILVAVSLDPYAAQSATAEVPLWNWGLPDDGAVLAENLLDGGTTVWQGKQQTLRLTPERPYALWRARPAV